LRSTSGAFDPEEPLSGVVVEVELLLVLDFVPVPDVVPGLALEDVVGGIVRTEVAAGLPVGGEVGGGITELEAACARTPDVVKSKKLRRRANKAQRDAIAGEKRSLEGRR
jgi:hypothetical protein